ncbi:hypothetical protein D3C86_2007020 [compost metagenome]
MMQLQQADGVVKSVLEVREIRSELNDADFALWYEEHFMITEQRVLGILAASRGMGA